MRTERTEAMSVFRKWLDESSLLYCELSFRRAAVGLEVKISSLSEELILLRSDDARSEMRVALDLAVAFAFEDTRRFPSAVGEFDFGLVVFFEEPELTEDPENIALIAKRS